MTIIFTTNKDLNPTLEDDVCFELTAEESEWLDDRLHWIGISGGLTAAENVGVTRAFYKKGFNKNTTYPGYVYLQVKKLLAERTY